ncbi:MAG: site-specific integrase [Corallococcus sp.]|nr:site-specific integrase [Corallococcus sp.]
MGNVTTPKTATSIRTLPMFSRTAELFEQGKSGNVFTYPRKVYQNSMLKICKRLNFDGINIHSLRHTFATRCSEQGIAVKVVQKWLGHSTLEMTLNVYTHVNADFEAKEVAKIDTQFDTHAD